MTRINQSHPSHFILCGLLNHSSAKDVSLFLLFTITYCISLIGNVTVILTIALSSSLYTPMYFFLTNLAILDLCCISTTVPKMLHNFVIGSYTIMYHECAVQLFMFSWVTITELLLLTYMAFDRYIAICKPLHYTSTITHTTCIQASASVWIAGALSSSIHTSMTFSLSFCDGQEINHFFCEVPSLIKLSCTDTTLNEMATLITDLFLCIICVGFIGVSYFFIISSISHIRSAEGKRKAISTCTSHILVVFMFYGTLFVAYVKPIYVFFQNQHKFISIVYGIYIPLLNPLIYTLKNRDMTNALNKLSIKIRSIVAL